MIKTSLTTILGICLVALFTATAIAGPTATGHEDHYHGAELMPAVTSTPPDAGMPMMPAMMESRKKEMMERMSHGGMMPGQAGMDATLPSARLQMMGRAHAGPMAMEPEMMRRIMDSEFFLDRIVELGLHDDQVEKLRAIRSACRKDNIRTGAEARIVRLELDDLLELDEWSPATAEKLIRQQQKFEGDMQVRHLQAVAEARKVLTREQLQRVRDGGGYLPMETMEGMTH